MAQPVFYQTLNMVGFDPTLYYTFTASVTPETPAPPFIVGTQGFGSDGSQFVFVQASTSISLTDFVMITQGASGNFASSNGFIANSLTSTNVASSCPIGVGSSGLILKQSVSYIPAGAYFWALTRGVNVPGYTSGAGSVFTQGNATTGVFMYTTATPGVITSLTLSTAAAFVGIVCVNSITTSSVGIAASIIPPAGNVINSLGLIVGPVFNLNYPRPIILQASAGAAEGLAAGTYSLPITGF